jgi:hypothetical protein
MSTRTQLIFTRCAPIGVIVILLGFWPIAGYLPPPPASSTAEQIAAFYRDHAGLIRLGLVLSFAGCAAWGPWSPSSPAACWPFGRATSH